MAARDPADELFRFRVNGAMVTAAGPGNRPLGPMLRDELGLTGVKLACDDGACGLCSVLVDGETVRSCLYPLGQALGRVVVTVEGLQAQATLSRIQRAFLKWGVPQCGFCAPAMLIAATELLGTRARPREAEIRAALSGVLCRCTGYNRFVGAVAEAVGNVEMPLPPPPGQAVGRDVPAVDGRAKVTGGLRFAADQIPKDVLWLRLVRARRGPARISFGSFAPLFARHPGLRHAFTASDLPPGLAAGVQLLAAGRVDFPGEPVCALVGNLEALAALLDEALALHYEPQDLKSPAGLSADAAPPAKAEVRHGAPEEAFAGAAQIAEGHFALDPFAPAPVEAEAGFAAKRQGGLDLHLALDDDGPERRRLAEALGLPLEKVRVSPVASAGRFGVREVDASALLLGFAVWTLDRPVALFAAPETMTAAVEDAPRLRVKARLAADREGRLLAIESDISLAAYASSKLAPALVAGLATQGAAGPYALAAARASARAFPEPRPPLRASRGLGAVEAAIWREALVDDLAAALGLDRLEIRRRNAPVGPQSLGPCLDALAPHWRRALDEVRDFNAGRRARRKPGRAGVALGLGLGVAGGALDLGTGPAEATVRIALERGGRLRLESDAEETGQGISTALVQIAADALGLAMTDFAFVPAENPAESPLPRPRARGVAAVQAAAEAARALRRKLLDLGRAGAAARIEIEAGRLRLIEPEAVREVALADLPADGARIVAAAEAHAEVGLAPSFAAHLALVEVDRALGTARIVRVVAVQDIGRVIHPAQAAGQIEGAIAQALGFAAMAAVGAKGDTGAPWSPIPRLGQVPPIEIVWVPNPAAPAAAPPQGVAAEGIGPKVIGPKAIGPKVIGPWAAAASAAAIVSAIRDATGLPLRELPATPARLRAHLAVAPPASPAP